MDATVSPDCLCHVEEKRLRLDPEEFEKRGYAAMGPCGSVDKTSSVFQLLRAKAIRSKNREKELSALDNSNPQAAKIIATDGVEMVPVCMNHVNPTSRKIVTLERLFQYGRDVNDGEAPGMGRRISIRRQNEEKRALAKLIKEQKSETRDKQVSWRVFNNKPTTNIRIINPAEQGIEVVGHNETVNPDAVGPVVVPSSFAQQDPTAPTAEEQNAPVISPRGDFVPKARGWKKKDNK